MMGRGYFTVTKQYIDELITLYSLNNEKPVEIPI